MEIIFFLLFIAICVGGLIWLTRKSSRGLSRSAPRTHKSGENKLHTPADNVLGHREELWQTRCKNSTADVVKTNRFVPKSETSREPEYDGYSRRDRHHVTADSVHVKDEAHA